MLILKCDRCGKEVVQKDVAGQVKAPAPQFRMKTGSYAGPELRVVRYPENTYWDLCDECLNSFRKWAIPKNSTHFLKGTNLSKEEDEKDDFFNVTFADLHDEPIKDIPEETKTKTSRPKPIKKEEPVVLSKEEALRLEISDLEHQMNQAYARGNDKLGDIISDRLEKKRNEQKSLSPKEEKVLVKPSKPKKTGRPYTRLLKFKTYASRDAFIYKYEKYFAPYPSFWYFKAHTNMEWEPKDEDMIKAQLSKGYCVDPKNKLYVRIRIHKNQFKIIQHLFFINHVGKGFNDVEYVEK